jgi:hypothetical protein
VGHLGTLGIAVPQPNDQLTRGQGHACVCGLGHQVNRPAIIASYTARSLPVVDQKFERRACAVAEHIDGALEGVVAQGVPAHGRESINAFAKIHRFGG